MRHILGTPNLFVKGCLSSSGVGLPNMAITLADRVASAMAEKGCTSTELATACGIKLPSVSDWLNGKTKTLKARTAHRAAEFLNVNILWLTEGRGPRRAKTGGSADSEAGVPPPTIEGLLASLRDKLADQPETVRKLVATMVSEYVATPDKETGERIAEAIQKIIKK